MPLTRANVTAASRITLPFYVVFYGVTGLNYLLTPRDRLLETPALSYADRVMPLPAWGGLFLIAALLMAAALVTGHRGLFRYALLLCGLSMTVWTVLTIAAAFGSSTSPGAWVYPALAVVGCIASYRSLTAGEAT